MLIITNPKDPSKTFDGVTGNQSARKSGELQSSDAQPHHNPPPPILFDFNDILAALSVGWRVGNQTIHEPWFPKAIQLGPRCRRWVREEVLAAIKARPRSVADIPQPEPLKAARARAKVKKEAWEAVVATQEPLEPRA